MRRGAPIAFVIGVKEPRRTKQSSAIPSAAQKNRGESAQHHARHIVCRFLRGTIFTKRISFALGAAVYLLITLVQPTASSAASVDLGWNASSDSNVVGYNVYYGTSSGVYTNETYVGDTTNAVVTGLVPGVTYYFSATSVDADGQESAFSTEIAYTIPNPNAVVLAMNTVQTGGTVSAITLTASGDIPAQWTIESSSDLQTWTPLISGTSSTVNVTIPITSLPHQFFRLVNQ